MQIFDTCVPDNSMRTLVFVEEKLLYQFLRVIFPDLVHVPRRYRSSPQPRTVPNFLRARHFFPARLLWLPALMLWNSIVGRR